MNEVSLLQSLGHVSASQTAEVFRDFLRRSLLRGDLRGHGRRGHWALRKRPAEAGRLRQRRQRYWRTPPTAYRQLPIIFLNWRRRFRFTVTAV
jgi:hypothetical protein